MKILFDIKTTRYKHINQIQKSAARFVQYFAVRYFSLFYSTGIYYKIESNDKNKFMRRKYENVMSLRRYSYNYNTTTKQSYLVVMLERYLDALGGCHNTSQTTSTFYRILLQPNSQRQLKSYTTALKSKPLRLFEMVGSATTLDPRSCLEIIANINNETKSLTDPGHWNQFISESKDGITEQYKNKIEQYTPQDLIEFLYFISSHNLYDFKLDENDIPGGIQELNKLRSEIKLKYEKYFDRFAKNVVTQEMLNAAFEKVFQFMSGDVRIPSWYHLYNNLEYITSALWRDTASIVEDKKLICIRENIEYCKFLLAMAFYIDTTYFGNIIISRGIEDDANALYEAFIYLDELVSNEKRFTETTGLQIPESVKLYRSLKYNESLRLK